MKLPPFDYIRAASVKEALEALTRYGEDALLLAGGTDLVVRLKQHLVEPKVLIGISGLKDLRYILEEGGEVRIGAMTPLKDLISSEVIRTLYPALHQAARSVGSVAIQHARGTVAGNICLETRCRYYNQSKFWRSSRNPCYKAGGQTCFAEEQGQKCRSVCQSDLAPALTAMVAMVEIQNSRGRRIAPLASFYTGEGEKPFDLAPDEMITEIRLPLPEKNGFSVYQKLRHRGAVDFPLVGVACSVSMHKGTFDTIRIVVGAMHAAPLLVKEATPFLRGKEPSLDTIEEASRMAKAQAMAYPVDNVDSTAAYRQKMVHVLARRALTQAVENSERKE